MEWRRRNIELLASKCEKEYNGAEKSGKE